MIESLEFSTILDMVWRGFIIFISVLAFYQRSEVIVAKWRKKNTDEENIKLKEEIIVKEKMEEDRNESITAFGDMLIQIVQASKGVSPEQKTKMIEQWSAQKNSIKVHTDQFKTYLGGLEKDVKTHAAKLLNEGTETVQNLMTTGKDFLASYENPIKK